MYIFILENKTSGHPQQSPRRAMGPVPSKPKAITPFDLSGVKKRWLFKVFIMQKKHCAILVLMLAFLCCSAFSAALSADDEAAVKRQKPYIFYTGLESPIHNVLDARIQEAFRRLNLKARVQVLTSSQRALILANEEGDGDAARLRDIKDYAPQNTANLVLVPESIITMEMSVYTRNLMFPVTGWESLEKYRNGGRIGAKFVEKELPGKRSFLTTTVQLVQMLKEDRIDTMVEWGLIADATIEKLKINDLKKLSPPIQTKTLYLYLHKKHQSLVPALTKVLRQMKEDGSFENITKEFVFYTGVQSPVLDILEGRFHEAFRRIGLRFKLVNPGSSERALFLANEDGDGDANRIGDIKQIASNISQNLVIIPEPINSITFYVYNKGSVLPISGYQSISDLRNGFRVGAKILEKNVPGNRTILPDIKRIFQMLNDGRLDTVIELPYIAEKIIKENNYSGITRLTPPLLDLPAYGFIHKKHQALIPEIVKALKEMRADGTFLKIEEDVLKKFNLN